jgi:DoxX-like family
MTKKKIAFIVITSLFALGTLPGAFMNLTQPPMVAEVMTKLGLPLHILTLVGTWKFLGLVALAAPARFGRIKEWAYAGFFFDLTGAAFLHAAAGDTAGIAPSLVLVSVLVASYLLRPARGEAPGEAEQRMPTSSAVAAA